MELSCNFDGVCGTVSSCTVCCAGSEVSSLAVVSIVSAGGLGRAAALLANAPILLKRPLTEPLDRGVERVIRVTDGESADFGVDRGTDGKMTSIVLAETGVDSPFS